MLLSNAVDLLTTWGRLLMMRAAIRQQQRQRGGSREVESDLRESVWWLIATELLILIGAWLWYELLSLASYRAFHFILEQGGGTSGLKVFANPRMHNLCCVTWYLGIFTRIVLGPLLPPQDLEKQVVILRGLQGLPTWRAIVLDPRITLLHLHSGLEVRLLSTGLAWGREKILGQGGPMWWRGDGEGEDEEEEEEEEMETPRAPREERGPPFFGGWEWERDGERYSAGGSGEEEEEEGSHAHLIAVGHTTTATVEAP